MEQDLKTQVDELQRKLDNLSDLYYRTNIIDKQIYQHPSYFKGDVYLPEKIAFFGGGTAIQKPSTISHPSGGATVDTEARAAISSIITTLQTLGLIA